MARHHSRRGMVAKAIGFGLVLGAASACYAATLVIQNFLGLSSDLGVGLCRIDAAGQTTAGETSPSSFSFVLVTVPGRLYVVNANGYTDNDSNPNRAVWRLNDPNVNGVAVGAADTLEDLVYGPLAAQNPLFSSYFVLWDRNPADDDGGALPGPDSLASSIAIGRFGTAAINR